MKQGFGHDRVPTRIFDLKGSMRNRKVESTGERNEVLLDENMGNHERVVHDVLATQEECVIPYTLA
jgi:hypothetical protein